MTFPINVNIPAASNYPGNDQPAMQTNFANINSYLKVDHTNPSAVGAGQHAQVTFNANNIPGALGGAAGIAYTDAGNLKFLNAVGTQILTGSILTSTGNDGAGGSYQLFTTPWGLRIFTGTTLSISGTNSLTMSGGVLFGATIYTGQLTNSGSGSNNSYSFQVGAGTGGFIIKVSGSATTFRWFVIST